MKRILYLALLALLCAYALADCSVSITQSLGSAWKQDGKDRSQWNAVITAGSEAVKSVQLSITGANIVQVWELERQSNGLYALPAYRLQAGGLAAGQSHQFGYIWESASQATITVAAINCGSVASPSAAPASPSASPAAPSPSASAAPASPSPSTIVATPQPSQAPSDCRVSATQTARAANQGGSWTEGEFKFQIYDLTVANTGSRAVIHAHLTITLAADQEITQSWNLNRQTDGSYMVSNAFGPLQVGATIGAGYVVKSRLSSTSAAPSVAVKSVECSGSAVSPSPAAPSPSANPTIVASPQPSQVPTGCSATVSIVARSAANGGVWQDGGKTFQIFDLTITNNGQRPLNGGVVSFTLNEASAAITQFWELSRQGSSNAFNVSFSYGALQVGASQGAGIVVSVSGSSPAGVPQVALGSLGCQ